MKYDLTIEDLSLKDIKMVLEKLSDLQDESRRTLPNGNPISDSGMPLPLSIYSHDD